VQLSLVDALNVTLLVQLPPDVFTNNVSRARIAGNSWSSIVTVKVQALVLPLASVAVQVTIFRSLGKAAAAGRHTVVGHARTIVRWRGGEIEIGFATAREVFATMFAGHRMAGNS
jgi:hypothetical protein